MTEAEDEGVGMEEGKVSEDEQEEMRRYEFELLKERMTKSS